MKKLLLLLAFLAIGQLQAQTCDYALSFPGFNSYVDCGPGSNFRAEGALTVEAWINLPNTTTNQKIAGNIDPFTNSGFELGIQNGGLYCEVKDTLGLHAFTAPTVPAGVWTHVAFTYRVSGRFRGYVNGVMVMDTTATNQFIGDNGTTNFRIGAAPWDPNYFVANGQIDEVRVYDVERNISQIRQDMHMILTAPSSGLIGYWPFSEGTGTAVADHSGANHNGTLSGTILPTWQVSNGPYGEGLCSIQYSFGTTTTLSFPGPGLDITSNMTPITDTFVVSRITCAPGGTQPTGSSTFNNGYWIVDRYGSSTPLTTTLDFFLPAGTVSAGDSAMPSNLRLYYRDRLSTGAWTNSLFATAASETYATVTFPFVSQYGQFMIGTNGNSTLGLTSLDNKNSFSIYPNPAVHECKLNLMNITDASSVISVMDLDGRMIKEITPVAGLKELIIDASGLLPGIYQVVLNSTAGRHCERLVVTN